MGVFETRDTCISFCSRQTPKKDNEVVIWGQHPEDIFKLLYLIIKGKLFAKNEDFEKNAKS